MGSRRAELIVASISLLQGFELAPSALKRAGPLSQKLWPYFVLLEGVEPSSTHSPTEYTASFRII